MALERKEAALKEVEGEREKLMERCHDAERQVATLLRANEEARQTRALALEQRSKVSWPELV